MIYYNLNTINDWNYGTSNIIKVYRNNAICYYKIDSSSPSGQTPCYAVVEDISQYQETEFEDVFNKADGLWYKLNNLNQYEEYGVYGSGRNVTTYEGKLTIDGDYEYQYSGSGWNNVGEVSGSSRVPAGYSEVEYIENTGSSYINTTLQLCSATTNTFQVEAKLIPNRIGSQTYQNIFVCMSEAGEPYQGFTYRFIGSNISPTFIPSNDGSFTQVSNEDGTKSVTVSSMNGLTYSHTYPLTICCGLDSSRNPFRFTNTKVYTFKVTLNNGIVGDYVPAKRDSDSVYGLYDLISDSFLTSPNGNNFVGGSVVTGTTIYPIYYDEIQDPPNNVTFTSMTEAEDYQCPWIGMHATIAGDNYIFSGDSQSGYEWVYQPPRIPTAYTEVEYIENTSTAYINTDLQIYSSTTNSFEVEAKLIAAKHDSQSYQNVFSCMSEDGEPYQGFVYRYQSSSLVGTSIPNGQNTFTIVNNEDSTQTVTVTSSSSQRTYTHTYPLTLFCGLNSSKSPFRWTNSKFYYCKVKMNDVLVRDLVPCKRDSDDKYGMYDIVNDVFYVSPNNVNFSGGDPV